MTPSELIDKLDLFMGAPDAVPRVRSLILQLAVRGRLVPQILCEGNADFLLGEIGNRKGSAEEELAPDRRWHSVPSSWRWVRLGSLGEIIGGGTPRSDNPAYFSDSRGIPWVTPADLNGFSEKRIFAGRRFITPRGLSESSARLLPEGSVLFSSRAPIGYVAIAGTELATNQGFKSCVPFVEGVSEYLYYYLMSASARIDAEAPGTTFREVSGRLVSQIPVSLPPLAEQKRIVAKVDELMALCDLLEAQQKERAMRHAELAHASVTRFADAPTPGNLTFLFHKSYDIQPPDIRKTALRLAVEGRLVPQDPDEEPADELFSRIQRTKQRLLKPGKIKLSSFEPIPRSQADKSLPMGWLWTRLGDVFDVRDGTHDTPKYTHIGFPLVTSKNISSGILSFDHVKLISEADHRQISERSRVDRGDILFAMIGSIGNPVIVQTNREFSIKNVALFKYYATADAEPGFLLLYLKHVAEEMRSKAAGGVQPFVSLGFLRNYLFPLPPLAEQRRVVAKTHQLMAVVDELESQLVASLSTGKKLLDSVVAELIG